MFELEIVKQYWINDDLEDKYDLCSHGLVYLKIGNNVITDEYDVDWTISTAGLILLRSLKLGLDHKNDPPVFQCCGQLSFCGCPISISWDLELINGKVKISNIYKLVTTNEKDIKYFDTDVILEYDQYKRSVFRFCNKIKNYFADKECEFENIEDKLEYEEFWKEFNRLYSELK